MSSSSAGRSAQGWPKYTHFRDARIADNIFLSTYAGKNIKSPEPEFRPLLCPRCSEKNTHGMKYCGRCSCPLDSSELARSSVEMEELRREMSQIKAFWREYSLGLLDEGQYLLQINSLDPHVALRLV